MPDWNDPSVVAFFAGRPPDDRVVDAVTDHLVEPPARVLDVGCAGGRNAVFLASHGFEVHAVDASPAMVRTTHERLLRRQVQGTPNSVAREGRIGAIGTVVEGTFDLVLALGVLQHARSDEEFDAAVADLANLVAPRGIVIVAHFTPASRPYDRALRRVPGSEHLYAGWDGPDQVMSLHGAADLDAQFARHGLVPMRPSTEVERPHVDASSHDGRASGRRVTCNAIYQPARR